MQVEVFQNPNRYYRMPNSRQIHNQVSDNIDHFRLKTLPKVNTLVHPYPNYEEPSKKGSEDKTKKPQKSFGYFKYGSAMFASGLLMFALFDPMIGSVLNYNFQLRQNGLTTAIWLLNPIPIHSCWYIFGIQNAEKFYEGAKPHLKEFGPFCFDVYRNRTVLEWKENSVTYMEQFKFEFNEADSAPADTRISIINLPIVAAVLTAKNIMEQFYVSFLGPVVYNTITLALKATGEQLVVEITARQLMQAWKVNIIQYINAMMAPFRSIGIPLPDFKEGFLGIIDHSFGITSSIGYFIIGPFEAYTNSEHGRTVGHAFKFEDSATYPYFESPCNKIGGSDGIFHPRPVEAKHLYVYIHHLCRVLRFDRNISHYYKGCKVVRYNMDERMFDMSLKRNRCFCIKKRSLQECDGWTDFSPCVFGLPLGLSFPHYLNSPRRQKDFVGLKPNRDIHFGHMEIEPQLGVPVDAQIMVQGIMNIMPISSVSALAKIRSVQLPIVWVKIYQGADTAALASLLFLGSNGLRYGSYGFLLGGMGLSGLLFSLGAYKRIKNNQSDEIEKVKK